jgi:hypothetical protein
MVTRAKKLFSVLFAWHSITRMNLGIVLVVLLPLLLYGTSGCNNGQSAADLFEQAWKDFDQNYSYFIHKNIDWNAVKTQYQANFQKNMTADQFAEEFNNVLQVLHDWHVWVQKPNEEFLGYNGNITTNYTSNPRNRYAPNGYQSLGNGIITHGIVGENGENIAYIRIETLDTESFKAVSDQDIESLFTTYADASGMIIDIRPNSGGNEENAAKFASRFTDASLLFGKVTFRNGPNHDNFDPPIEKTLEPSTGTHFNKKAVCLIGQRVMSSGEWFTLMMKVCPNVTLMGDHTRGASGGPEVFSLKNGVKYNISRWVAYTYDDVAFEDHGIEPAIKIPPEQSFDDEHDYVVEQAIAFISGGGPVTTTIPAGNTTSTIPGGVTTTISGGVTTTIPGGITTSIPGGATTTIPSQGGKPIIVSFTVNPSSGDINTEFTLTCQAEDTDGGFVLFYYWDWDGDLSEAEDWGGWNIYKLYGVQLGAGSHKVSVMVEDDDGKQSDIKSVNVTVTP